MAKRLFQVVKLVSNCFMHLGRTLIIAALLFIIAPNSFITLAEGGALKFPLTKPFPNNSGFKGINSKIVCKIASPSKASVAYQAKRNSRLRSLKTSDLSKVRSSSGKRVKISELTKACISQYISKSDQPRDTNATPTPSPTPSFTSTVVASPTPTITPHPDASLPTPCDLSNSGCSRITDSTAEANFGDAINIFGGRFGESTRMITQEIDPQGSPIIGTRVVATTILKHDAMIQFRLQEKNSTRKLIASWADTNGQTSNIHFINKPKIQALNDHSIRPGGTLVIWGNLLSLSDTDLSQSSVYLVSNQVRIKAQIVGGSKLSLTISIPSSVPIGAQFKIVVSNGLGGTLGESTFKDSVISYPASLDPIGLGTGWAAEVDYLSNQYNAKTDPRLSLHPIGDGISDDSNAIQAGLDYIGLHGGGVLYLPQGTYKLSQPLLLNHSKVCLLGAGKAFTSLVYGAIPGQENYAIAFAQNNVSLTGVAKLRIVNENGARALNRTIINHTKTGIHKVFVLDLDIIANKGVGPSFSEVDDLVFRRNIVTQSVQWNYPGRLDGPFHANKTNRLIFSNNELNYKVGRVHVVQSKDAVIANNHLRIDGSDSNLRALIADRTLTGNLNEVGGLELGFSRDTSVVGNSIEVSPIPNLTDPDIKYFYGLAFELVMTQTSIYHFYKAGEITAVNGAKIYDSSKNWNSGDLEPPLGMRPYLTITNGPGLGQSREIIDYSQSEVTLDSSFSVSPVAGESSYVISYWINDNLLIQDNDLTGGHAAVVIYDGGRDVSIRRNFVTDSGTIYVHGKDLDPSGSRIYLRYLASNISITDNTTQSTVGNYGANIRVATYQHLNQVLHGMSVFNAEVLRNNLVARTPSTVPNEWADFDGVIHTVVGGAGHDTTGQSAYPGPLVSVYGIIVANNASMGGPSLPNGKTLYKTPGVFGLIEEKNSYSPTN